MSIKMYTSTDTVTNSDYLDINFSSAGFSHPPLISASVNDNITVYVSNITSSTARLNFSVTFTGSVSYVVRSPTN